jgi:hypothetical protein
MANVSWRIIDPTAMAPNAIHVSLASDAPR